MLQKQRKSKASARIKRLSLLGANDPIVRSEMYRSLSFVARNFAV